MTAFPLAARKSLPRIAATKARPSRIYLRTILSPALYLLDVFEKSAAKEPIRPPLLRTPREPKKSFQSCFLQGAGQPCSDRNLSLHIRGINGTRHLTDAF